MMKAEAHSVRKISSGLIALKKIVEGTSDYTGGKFFRLLVKNLAETLDAHGVWVTEYLREKNRLRSLAFWLEDHFVEKYEYDVPGTPCEPVLKNETICHVPDNVISLFPNDPDLPPLGAVSYMGVALRDENGDVLGHLALLDNKPMVELPEAFAIFKIFAARAGAELRRMRYEKMLIDNEAKLSRLVNGTQDALLEINEQLMITQANKAAVRIFTPNENKLIGQPLKLFFDSESFKKLCHLFSQQENNGNFVSPSFRAGQLRCIASNNKTFPADATISGYYSGRNKFIALFLRNLSDSFRDKEQIKRLNTEAAILREKISEHNFENIIGESPQIRMALQAVEQVAASDTTVLIRGETGTGKELFAQAIHKRSKRQNKPLITLNCAALPAELVESELFGHVKGAFTGAVVAREGRFLLADGGTIFLDEIGELPLPLQAKLLRVIQEGEFEPVGSSKTQRVNVRIIAATHRDLEQEIEQGKFRQDLFYRLNVFPIDVPPLRERGDDVILLAEAFLKKFAKRSALPVFQLDEAGKQKLLSYHWPGNVRELQNIIERCIITSQSGKLNLFSLLSSIPRPTAGFSAGDDRIYTEQEMTEMEKNNIIKALELTNWKVSGEDGAAALLQIPPTTLNSRITKLGIIRRKYNS
jgi:transcriptional regulator with PAS, ATPase and Fis domain